MEYMPLLLRQFLSGSAPELPANEFKAYLLCLAHIYENEAPVSDRTMERHLTVKGWRNAKAGLVAKNRLFTVPGGVMDEVALNVLHDYHQQQTAASERGKRAGLISAAKRRTGGKQQAVVSDLFANRLQSTRIAEKANEINDSGQQTVGKRAPARTRGKRVASGLHPSCNSFATEMLSASEDEKPNKNKGGVQHPVNQREGEREEEYSPLSPHDETEAEQPELVEGTVEDEFAIPKRKAGKPLPRDWTPEAAQLSDAVANLIAEWPDGELEREGVKFVEDAQAKDRRHVNWDRAFGVWLTKHDGFMADRRKRNERTSGWANA